MNLGNLFGGLNMDPKVDYSKLPDDLKAKLIEIDRNSPQNLQLRTLQDIADMTQEVISIMDSQQAKGDKSSRDLGAVLLDIRQSLADIKTKEAPEPPDYAKPVVDGLGKLEKALTGALGAINVSPVVNVPESNPQVHVEPPHVDLKGVEQVLKVDMPKAFERAIKALPKTEIPKEDYTPLLEALSGIAEQLSSLETATRMKPTAPKVVGVTNPDGSLISGGGSGTQYTDGSSTITHPIGTIPVFNKAGTITAVSDTNPLPTSATVSLTNYANETGGNLATIAAKDFATQTTLALIKAKTDNLDVALSTRTKPADAQHVIVDSGVTTGLTDTQLRATPVPVSGTFFQTTQPVSAAALPLPLGASTSAVQTTGNASLSSIDGKLSGTLATSSATLPQADLPAAPVNNQKTVTTAGTAVQLQTNTLKVGVIVQALSTNTGLIYVGSSSVSAANGFELQPGQATSVAAGNTNSIWLDASVNGDKACWIGS